jgi:endonuclease/exonuclease/phosphatase family metal-dependent hydrolase
VSRLAELVHLPRLVAADLNANEASEPARIFAEAGYRDTFRVLHPSEEALTYHGFRGRGARNLGKIDYLFCDAHWDVLAASVVRDGREGRFPSDHFPVTAEVVLRRRATHAVRAED